LKRRDFCGSVANTCRLNFGGVLAGANGERVGTDLREGEWREHPAHVQQERTEATSERASREVQLRKSDRIRVIRIVLRCGEYL